MNLSQTEMIMELLEDGIGLTPIDALEHAGCFRLSARILELKEEGHTIYKTWHEYTNTFGEQKKVACYWLVN